MRCISLSWLAGFFNVDRPPGGQAAAAAAEWNVAEPPGRGHTILQGNMVARGCAARV